MGPILFTLSCAILLASCGASPFFPGSAGLGSNGRDAGGVLTVTGGGVTLTPGRSTPIQGSGGSGPYAYSIDSGGVGSIDPFSGIFNSPWQVGSGTVRVTDALGNSVTTQIVLAAGAVMLGNAGTVELVKTVSDSQGNIFLCGQSATSFPNRTSMIGVAGPKDLFAAKLNPSGALQWLTEAGGGVGASPGVVDCLIDHNGNFDVLGNVTAPSTLGTELGSASNNGALEPFFAQFNPSTGNTNFLYQMGNGTSGSFATTVLHSVIEDANHNIDLLGLTVPGTVASFTEKAISIGAGETFLGQFSPDGSTRTLIQYGSATGAPSQFNCVLNECTLKQHTNGDLYFVGSVNPGDHPERGVIGSFGIEALIGVFHSDLTPVYVVQVGNGPGNSGTITSTDVIMDSSNNLVMVGIASASAGPFAHLTEKGTGAAPSIGEPVIAKLDSSGTGVYAYLYGNGPNSSLDSIPCIFNTSTSGVETFGYVSNSGATTYSEQVAGGSGDAEIIGLKVDSSGIPVFMNQYGNGAGSFLSFSSCQKDGNANVNLLGSSVNGAVPRFTELASSAGNAASNKELMVAQLTEAGVANFLVEIGAGNATSSTEASMIIDASDDILVEGFTNGTLGTLLTGNVGTQDLVFGKLNSSGVLQWMNQFGTTGITQSSLGFFLDSSSGDYFTYDRASGSLPGTFFGVSGVGNATLNKFSPAGVWQ